MTPVTITDLKLHTKRYFDAVERGETLEVHRRGRPIALVTPVREPSIERWQTPDPLRVSGVSLSAAILGRRKERRR
jgi:prevent-host-death family protein